MDVREKLVELLLDIPFGNRTEEAEQAHAENVAEYRIANGVTVQEWISVNDRLPETYEPVLVKYLNYNDGSASHTNVDTAVLFDGNVWYWWEGDICDCDEEVKCTISHWMPLPQPPKGE